MSGVFGGSQSQPIQPSAPTAVAPPPDRSDEATKALADRQKKRFTGAGSATSNFFGGIGNSAISTIARTLGGTQ